MLAQKFIVNKIQRTKPCNLLLDAAFFNCLLFNKKKTILFLFIIFHTNYINSYFYGYFLWYNI